MSKAYSPAKDFKHAELLYQILPSAYRERDDSQDLKKFMEGCGLLLDQVHRTLLQRYADIFPDDSEGAFGLDSQAWLLPYIAALFDVRLVSPLESGRRQEIANAIAWRKAKGTRHVVEQVAEAVGGMEVIVQEGWKRVATTARIGTPVLPLESYGYMGYGAYADNFQAYHDHRQPDLASMWAKHPGLPAGTVDLRCQAAAVAASEDNPAAVVSRVDGKTYRWRQSSLHGARSCNPGHSVLPFNTLEPDWIPGYFDDPSVRTVDLRNPNWRQGHFHPRRVLLFAATQSGFFADTPDERHFSWSAALPDDEAFRKLVDVRIVEENLKAGHTEQKTVFRNRTLDKGPFQSIQIRLIVKPDELSAEVDSANPPIWRFEGFNFINTIQTAESRLEFDQCALLSVETETTSLGQPVLQADNCLFKRIQAGAGLVRLQYCTVLTITIAEKLQASDCIFNGLIQKALPANIPPEGCVRYSAVLPQQSQGELQFFQHHPVQAVFANDVFSDTDCGVLHPATPAVIANGAEDGGEMGAYHHLHLTARQQAVISKLGDFLPVGMKPVIIPDSSLHDLPGEFTATSEPA